MRRNYTVNNYISKTTIKIKNVVHLHPIAI